MVLLEFTIEGPAVSIRAARKNARRYQKWLSAVRKNGVQACVANHRPTEGPVQVSIVSYFAASPPDVDNIIKPILDALNGVAYVDDEQVFRVMSEKIEVSETVRVTASGTLAAAFEQGWLEVVQVTVTEYEEAGSGNTFG
jgi:crossover junction endodeoxyribonuclease RusA